MDKKYILLSPVEWKDMLQRPHHIARSLAKIGHEVEFIEHAFHNIAVECSSETIGNEELQKLLLPKVREVIDGVSIVNPTKVYFNDGKIYDSTRQILEEDIKNSNKEIIIIAYLFSSIGFIVDMQGDFKLIYDCVDDHIDADGCPWFKPENIYYEKLFIDRSDIVLTTSQSLYLSKAVDNNKVLLSKNAVNVEDFNINDILEEPEDLAQIPKPRICYIGAVFDWYDEKLFYEVIDKNRDKSFVVIGKIGEGFLKEERDNLYILGLKHHSELRKYLKHCDVGTIPFKDTSEIIINCDPVKMYEYLACKMPVVSTNLPEVCINKDFVKISSTADDFDKAINSLTNYQVKDDEVEEFLKANSWDSRAKDIDFYVDNIEKLKDNKKETLSNIRDNLRKVLEKDNNPIIKALYAQTFIEENVSEYLKYIEEAYNSLKIFYITKHYIYALYLNENIDKAIDVVLNSNSIKDYNKAELISSLESKSDVPIRIKLMYCIREYGEIYKLLQNATSNDYKDFEDANYLFALGQIEQCKPMYEEMLKDKKLTFISPIFNRNVSQLFAYFGELYNSQLFHFNSVRLIDKYLKKEDRLTRWNSIFSNKVSECISCDGREFDILIRRPDGINIIYCKKCGLTTLEYMPNLEYILKDIDVDFYTETKQLGIDSYYIGETTGESQVMKLGWIKQHFRKNQGNRLLDIGIKDNSFINSSRNEDWDSYGISLCKEGNEIIDEKVYDKIIKEVGFNDGFFDCVTIWDELQNFSSPISVLSEIKRILKKEGKVYLSVPNVLCSGEINKNHKIFNTKYEQLYYYNIETIKSIVKKAGFIIDNCFTSYNLAINDRVKVISTDKIFVEARKDNCIK